LTLAHLLLDALHELPTNPFQAPTRRRLPYIYTPAQIVQLVGAANRLRRSYPIRREVYATLLALIAATGLRIAATGRAYSSPLTKALCGGSKSGSTILSAVNSVEFPFSLALTRPLQATQYRDPPTRSSFTGYFIGLNVG